MLDNFSPHRHAEVRTWAADNEVELVLLPTYGSWLNWIESEFAALRYFALNGTDHRTHGEQNAAVAAYIRWRNSRAEPKTRFAPSHRSGSGPNTRPRLRAKPRTQPIAPRRQRAPCHDEGADSLRESWFGHRYTRRP